MPTTPLVDLDEATAMAGSALTGFNDGDYDRFGAEWSKAMKQTIPEDGSLTFRDDLSSQRGSYLSLGNGQFARGRLARAHPAHGDLVDIGCRRLHVQRARKGVQ
jgi:hypothetical protein